MGREEALPTPVGQPATNQPQNAYKTWKCCPTAFFMQRYITDGIPRRMQSSCLIIQSCFLPEHTFTMISFTTGYVYTFAVDLLQT